MGVWVAANKHFRENAGRPILSLQGDPEVQGLLRGTGRPEFKIPAFQDSWEETSRSLGAGREESRKRQALS